MLFALVGAAAVLLPELLTGQSSGGGQVITPPGSYSNPGWAERARKYQASLGRIQADLSAKFNPQQLRLLTTAEAAAGGIGFWANPANFGDPARYLCVSVRVQIPPPSTGRAFPDNQGGRVLTIMDAYGKYIISVLARELKDNPDPAGAGIVFIYGKAPLADPGFEQSAESLVFFMPRASVTAFAELRMTIQTLFSQSQVLPLLQGQDQISNLRLFILQP